MATWARRLSLLGAAICLSTAGCGDETGPGPVPLTGTGTGTGAAAGGQGGTGGGVGGTGGQAGTGTGTGTGGTLPFSIVDVPTTACSDLVATPVEIYGPDAMEGLDQLTAVGDRWAAGAAIYSGFVLFDSDGQNASPALTSMGYSDRIAGSSTGLSVATITAAGAEHGRYDAQGSPVGSVALVSADATGSVEVGRSGDEAMVVFSSSAGLQARGISAGDAPGVVIDLEVATDVDVVTSAVAAAGPSRFGIVWSERRLADDLYRTFFAMATLSGMSGLVREVHTGAAMHETVQLVATEGGFALLQELDGVALVVPLDEDGFLAGPAHRFVGTERAWSIAANGTNLALVAKREDDRDAYRVLGLDGAPTGDWVCLNPSSTQNLHVAAIHADGAGFAILYRDAADAEQLVHVTPPGS